MHANTSSAICKSQIALGDTNDSFVNPEGWPLAGVSADLKNIKERLFHLAIVSKCQNSPIKNLDLEP